MVHFVLIRHGQSANNLRYAQTGADGGRDPDTRLTDLGHTQAARLASVAADTLPWPVTHVYTSLMARAVQTAAPLAESLDLPLRAHPRLFECGGPHETGADGQNRAHPGSGRAELAALYPRLLLPPEAGHDGWWPGPFEAGESSYVERARSVVAELREAHSAEDVIALVTHGWFTQYLLREFLGISQMAGWFRINNTGISLVRDESGDWTGTTTADRINWLPHLAPHHVSE